MRYRVLPVLGWLIAALAWFGCAPATPTGIRRPTAAIEVAVTFDDLPFHGLVSPHRAPRATVAAIVQTLERHGVPEVYGFVNGLQRESVPEWRGILEDWFAAGHPLGNHTYSHLDLNDASVERFIDDIERNQSVLAAVGGSFRPRWFRFPYLTQGDTEAKSRAVADYLAAAGYRVAPVTIAIPDDAWNRRYVECLPDCDPALVQRLHSGLVTCALSALEAARRMALHLFGREVPQVLLLHAGPLQAETLDPLLTAYRSRGVRFVTLPRALSDEAYRVDAEAVSRSGHVFFTRVAIARGATVTRDATVPAGHDFPEGCRVP